MTYIPSPTSFRPTGFGPRPLSGGRTFNRRFPRVEHDFYPTPPEATRALLAHEIFHGDIWEPACGQGHISKVLTDAGYSVLSTDLIDRGYGEGGINFPKETRARAKNIITNPPYGRGLADDFIEHALNLTATTGGSVAMLITLESLCHPVRTAMWIRRPPAAIYGIDRLICYPNGIHDPEYDRYAKMRFCWVVWHKAPVTRPAFWWLSMADYQAKTEGGAA